MENEKIYNNTLILKKLQRGSNIIKVITIPRVSEDALVSSIISPDTFPYLNTVYSEIVTESFSELDSTQKTVVVGQIERIMNDLSDRQLKYIENIDPANYSEYFSVDEKDSQVVFSNIRGGEYIEMLLGKILLLEGFSKVMSKIDLEWGNLSPTGIDVVYIDLYNKDLVLGESKFYKNIADAIKSVNKDIDKIITGDKFMNEMVNWKSKVDRMPEPVSKWFIAELSRLDKYQRTKYIKDNYKISVVGFVAGNSIEDTKIIDHFEDILSDDLIPDFDVVIVVLPVQNKDIFIQKCLHEMHQLKENYDE